MHISFFMHKEVHRALRHTSAFQIVWNQMDIHCKVIPMIPITTSLDRVSRVSPFSSLE